MAMATYHRRKAARICIDCKAPLSEADKSRCPVHREVVRKKAADRRAADPQKAKLTLKAQRDHRKKIGLCQTCKSPALPGKIRCEHHQEIHREQSLRSKYGLSAEEYAQLLAKDDCGICGGDLLPVGGLQDRCPAIDHDHSTGKVRDILHRRCNMAIGAFDDDLSLLFSAFVYLTKHTEIPEVS